MGNFGLKEFVRKARRTLLPLAKPQYQGFALGEYFKQRAKYVRSLGNKAGKSRTPAEEAKRARRRAAKRADRDAVEHLARENRAGSKRVTRYAKAAGFSVDRGDGKGREPTAYEAAAWYRGLEEAPFLAGKRLRDPFDHMEMMEWLDNRSAGMPVRVT